ncbi:MAG: VWA domain-containing protein [Deltaproteobacteria bacterium]|nr:VWA domain-containing protein [Deltaproteobacteria bacterium]
MDTNHPQLILFLLDNSGSMNEGFGAVSEAADRAADMADRLLGGVLGALGRRVARETIRSVASKVTVLNLGFNGALVSLNTCRATPADNCILGTVRYGSDIRELFAPTPVQELLQKAGASWFSADLGMTNTVRAFRWAKEQVDAYLARYPGLPKPWIVHITDGIWNDGGDPTEVALGLMKNCLVFNALIDDHSEMKMARREFAGYSNPADVQLHLAANLVEISSRIPEEWIEAIRKVFPRVRVESRLFFPTGTEDLLKGVFEVVQELYAYLYGRKPA